MLLYVDLLPFLLPSTNPALWRTDSCSLKNKVRPRPVRERFLDPMSIIDTANHDPLVAVPLDDPASSTESVL